jgi:hypothetical protein
MRHGADDLMTHQPDISSTFEVIESQLGFLVFKATFHAPTCEGDV